MRAIRATHRMTGSRGPCSYGIRSNVPWGKAKGTRTTFSGRMPGSSCARRTPHVVSMLTRSRRWVEATSNPLERTASLALNPVSSRLQSALRMNFVREERPRASNQRYRPTNGSAVNREERIGPMITRSGRCRTISRKASNGSIRERSRPPARVSFTTREVSTIWIPGGGSPANRPHTNVDSYPSSRKDRGNMSHGERSWNGVSSEFGTYMRKRRATRSPRSSVTFLSRSCQRVYRASVRGEAALPERINSSSTK